MLQAKTEGCRYTYSILQCNSMSIYQWEDGTLWRNIWSLVANSSTWARCVSSVPFLSFLSRRLSEWQYFAARWSVLSSHGSNLHKLLLNCCKEDAGTKPAEGAGACGTCCSSVPLVLMPVHLHSFVLPHTPSSFRLKCQPWDCTVWWYNTGKVWGEEVSGVNVSAWPLCISNDFCPIKTNATGEKWATKCAWVTCN